MCSRRWGSVVVGPSGSVSDLVVVAAEGGRVVGGGGPPSAQGWRWSRVSRRCWHATPGEDEFRVAGHETTLLLAVVGRLRVVPLSMAWTAVWGVRVQRHWLCWLFSAT